MLSLSNLVRQHVGPTPGEPMKTAVARFSHSGPQPERDEIRQAGGAGECVPEKERHPPVLHTPLGPISGLTFENPVLCTTPPFPARWLLR